MNFRLLSANLKQTLIFPIFKKAKLARWLLARQSGIPPVQHKIWLIREDSVNPAFHG